MSRKTKIKLPCNVKIVEQYMNECLHKITKDSVDYAPYITVNEDIKVGDVLSLTVDKVTCEVEIISDEENKLINN